MPKKSAGLKRYEQARARKEAQAKAKAKGNNCLYPTHYLKRVILHSNIEDQKGEFCEK